MKNSCNPQKKTNFELFQTRGVGMLNFGPCTKLLSLWQCLCNCPTICSHVTLSGSAAKALSELVFGKLITYGAYTKVWFSFSFHQSVSIIESRLFGSDVLGPWSVVGTVPADLYCCSSFYWAGFCVTRYKMVFLLLFFVYRACIIIALMVLLVRLSSWHASSNLASSLYLPSGCDSFVFILYYVVFSR